ncbi:cytochrome c5 [Azomonas macrocytogenes]|uniref:Cytochrome c5 n=1 Tax=Azomonas macrocytogenes TaxID=69962 RepID=A0A839T2A0_AZOMA|nr:cytochrome c5 [Azomonas macrocytogenes]
MSVPAVAMLLGCLSAQAGSDDSVIARRLTPVGHVCIEGQPCTVTERMVVPARIMRSGEEITERFCAVCHGVGLPNAPMIGDGAAWKARTEQRGGLDALLASTIAGRNAMPPKGLCFDCTDEELQAAIEHMSGL